MNTQSLAVSITIPIPDDSVLISKIELQQLKENELHGVYWNMKDLEERTKRKHEWLKDNILFRPQFREELDSDHGGFVYYPKAKGQNWLFQASRMAEFLDKNFHRICKERVH